MTLNFCLHSPSASIVYVHYCTAYMGPGLKLGTPHCCASTPPAELFPRYKDLTVSPSQLSLHSSGSAGWEKKALEPRMPTFFQENWDFGGTLSQLLAMLSVTSNIYLEF